MNDPPNKPTVFISYSHKDEEWKDRLRPHLAALELEDLIELWDDRKIDEGGTWLPEIKAAMERAAVAVCLISPDYLASRFIKDEEIPYLLDRRERDGMLLLPVLVRPCFLKPHAWLNRIQRLPRDGKSIAVDYKDREDEAFRRVAELIYNKISDPAFRLAKPAPQWAQVPEGCIDIDRLPRTGTEVFGRKDELALLDQAWESETTRVISFVAWGGVGKSALVNKWVEQIKEDNYRGAKRVYAWSFYSQGTGERVASAD
ncbi:MAG: TIR domain-containing protein, partial [Phycisphaerales bacterium]